MKSPSPLRYPGGKASLINLVSGIIRGNSLDRGHYIEPFAGGAGLALSLLFRGDVAEVHLNDIDPAISAFWRSVLDDTDQLIDLIRRTEVSIEERARQREIYFARTAGDLLLGFSAFYLNRVNRSGIIKTGGVIGGLKQNGSYLIDCRFNKDDLIERIRRIGKYRSRIHFTSKDANDFVLGVQDLVPDRSFMYADPPYFMKGPELYTSAFGAEDHVTFFNTLCSSGLKWILTYDDVPEMRQLYCDYRIFGLSIGYSAQVKRQGEEILISSDNLEVSQVDVDHWRGLSSKQTTLPLGDGAAQMQSLTNP